MSFGRSVRSDTFLTFLPASFCIISSLFNTYGVLVEHGTALRLGGLLDSGLGLDGHCARATCIIHQAAAWTFDVPFFLFLGSQAKIQARVALTFGLASLALALLLGFVTF